MFNRSSRVETWSCCGSSWSAWSACSKRLAAHQGWCWSRQHSTSNWTQFTKCHVNMMTHFVSSQAHPFGQKASAEERRASSIIKEKANPFLVASPLLVANPFIVTNPFLVVSPFSVASPFLLASPTLPSEPALPEAISMASSHNFSVKPSYSYRSRSEIWKVLTWLLRVFFGWKLEELPRSVHQEEFTHILFWN